MEINEIKQSLSITTVLNHYGLKPNKHDMLNCPFHKDDKPSLKIYPKTNSFNCFGCEAGGDQIEFIQQKEKCNKHQALKRASSLINNEQLVMSNKKEITKAQTEPQALNQKERILILEKIYKQFSNGIKSKLATKPKEYLNKRNLQLENLEIGYNSGQFHHRDKLTKQELQACKNIGLLIEYKGYTPNGDKDTYTAFAKDCIIFPLRNKQNKIVSLYGRSIMDNNKSKHFYLKEREGLYPKYPAPKTKKLIITEAIIDASTLLQLPNISKDYAILSLFGTNGLTKEHSEAISQLKNLEEIIFFFDGDTAGKQAVEKYTELFTKEYLTIKISKIETPGGEDINSLHQMYDSQEYFLELIESRIILNQNKPKETESKPQQETLQPSNLSTLNYDNPEQIIYQTNELQITIWGGIEKENLSRLKISMHIKSKQNKYKSFRDDVNLYSHSGTKKLIENISEALEISTTTITKTITELTEALEAYRLEERQIQSMLPTIYEMSEQEKQEAKKLLKSKDLGKKTLELIKQSGLIGEEKNGLLLYFLYTSRLMDEPLHAIIFGKSGSGKTYLQTKISECLPEESVRTITSLTENTLYYSAKDFWKHKVLLIEDLEGVYNAFLPLREFMSKQSISKLTTDKDAKGNNIQKLLTVEGPICVSGATTKGAIYEDNANRSFLINIDESNNHLNKVMEYQRRASAGIINKDEQDKNKQLLKNAQRLLQKIKVINPYATDLYIPNSVFKKLRTNTHYLKLIEIITFYNQHNRKLEKSKTGEYYIKTEIADIELANWLVKETLLQKSDELNSDVRNFFETLKKQAEQENKTTFFAKEIRKSFRMHPQKLSRYLSQLEQRNYLKRLSSNRYIGFEYEIISFDDYDLLKEGINILDKILENIKEKNKDIHKAFTKLSQNSKDIQLAKSK